MLFAPTFPAYTGPHTVGSCDVEVPVFQLDSPVDAPDASLGTVAFRIFYPCEPESKPRPVKWLPSPQSEYVSAYCRFAGASPRLAGFLSYFPQFLYMTSIPVQRNAKLAQATTDTGRWPVLVFSHGLGGSRNAYSHICGSLASYGIIVIAPDHRDTSSPISFVRATETTEAKIVGYNKFSHTPSPEVYQGRDNQLRIRLWELGCIHDAMVRIDLGTCPANLDDNKSSKGARTEVLDMFRSKMNLHAPGSIAWAGHSFGATTMVQLLKSSYYSAPTESEKTELTSTLFLPSRDSPIVQQITPASVSLLLDMWCLPLRSKATRWLWNKPMPAYSQSHATVPPAGGSALLSVLSESFAIWDGNLNDTKRALAPTTAPPNGNIKWTPHFFYPEASAHLSQSDFGLVFPWLTARVLKTKEPDRLLRLNARAMLQVLRENGFAVAGPTAADLETSKNTKMSEKPLDDAAILKADGGVRGWKAVEMKSFKIKQETVASDDASASSGSGVHVEDDYQQEQAGEVDGADIVAPAEEGENLAMRPTASRRKSSAIAVH
ncbi:hypothetical protein BT63DRAFT_402606 [Microthyrium microscopicum]|uniref:Putative phospholipase n=1 Tax=Microthyrium microscopicum TaxID=703497 RepID=A0A6A6U9P8_9PEZI|nr:hypothetical protein BT63DRAFT_402606 [Microthyrium microscopicum]